MLGSRNPQISVSSLFSQEPLAQAVDIAGHLPLHRKNLRLKVLAKPKKETLSEQPPYQLPGHLSMFDCEPQALIEADDCEYIVTFFKYLNFLKILLGVNLENLVGFSSGVAKRSTVILAVKVE